MIVLELPPKAFYNILVRAASLYGTTLSLAFPAALSASTLITLPKILNEVLIAHPSFNLSPYAPVYPAFSEPAKSTRFITDCFYVLTPSSSSICRSSIVIIV